MNKRMIAGIIVVITIALLGLMGIQVHWIGAAMKVKEATFVRDVNQAMNHVIVNLEKEAMQRRFEHRMSMLNRQSDLISSWDSINNAMYMDMQNPMSQSDFEGFVRRSNMAQEMLQEMLFGHQSALTLNHQINPILIDSLISCELDKHGLRTPYEFGVYSPMRNAMLYQKTGKYPQQLLTESFVYELYPTSAPMRYAEQLLLYFPNERRYLVSKLWDLVFISGILILLIIMSFGATIYTIFRQKKLSEIRHDFVNNMTHEFKTPIATIGLACEALRDCDVQKTEGLYSSYLSMIDEENKRLGTMAEQILQSAVMDKGELVLRKENMDLHDVIRESVNTKMLQARKKNGNIYTNFEASRHYIRADKVHMTNVVLNLLDNAIKYCDGPPEILIRSRNIPNAIEISVQDNGIGISKANQKKIFEKLYRVPTGNIHNVKGFGLGLSYVKAIVEKHGGTVHLQSELKKGTTFYLRLPFSGGQ
jgi:two-component system, OmpR family, phosphate regulon sensor histidine kinase PhoR